MLANEAPNTLDSSGTISMPQVTQHLGRQNGNTFDSSFHTQASRYRRPGRVLESY